ncbi:MAG: hypothetical protein U0Q55_02270 [Vicinamibacterales bacterium]
MSALDDRIDQLYAIPAAEFVAARNALAKTLRGDDAARVKRLEKPTVVPWSVNQVYWHHRDIFERLMAAGRALRAAQVAALQGTPADLRAASAAHRAALSTAVSTAESFASRSGVSPSADALGRMFEALSLAAQPPGDPGRYTEVVAPAGFEALAGITPVAASPLPAVTASHEKPVPAKRLSPAAERKRLQEEAAAARAAADRAIAEARRRLKDAEEQEARVRAQVDLARQQLHRTEASLQDARALFEAAAEALARAESERSRL